MLAKDFVWGDGSCRKFMLEPYAVKVARTVLSGGKICENPTYRN